jgi:hypothetical protein
LVALESSLQGLQDGVGVGGYGDKNLGSFEGGRRVHSGDVWALERQGGRRRGSRRERRMLLGEVVCPRAGGSALFIGSRMERRGDMVA